MITACKAVRTAYDKCNFKHIFKGNAASSFRKLVTYMGWNECSYPYKASGSRVLVYWNGPDYRKLGNNLPGNAVPGKVDDDFKEIADVDPQEFHCLRQDDHDSSDESQDSKDEDHDGTQKS